ncbi:hypothetical protein B0H21DRAFT_252039 [Amylocystis lapponica]|nr:hypothetical protein B0H21DRAFT_252039 [Amylocystis lapponica]
MHSRSTRGFCSRLDRTDSRACLASSPTPTLSEFALLHLAVMAALRRAKRLRILVLNSDRVQSRLCIAARYGGTHADGHHDHLWRHRTQSECARGHADRPRSVSAMNFDRGASARRPRCLRFRLLVPFRWPVSRSRVHAGALCRRNGRLSANASALSCLPRWC